MIRIPPMDIDEKAGRAGPIAGRDLKNSSDHELLSRMLPSRDDKVIVLNKPAGIAVQGGSGINRHIDQMLEAWTSPRGSRASCAGSTATRPACSSSLARGCRAS